MLDERGGRVWRELPGPGFTPGMDVAGFIIEGLLATGSFGTVYRARRGGRFYAIKLVPIDPRGDREAAALRLMRHPNVVAFHGYGLWPEEEPRFLVLALQLVEGRTLDVWAEQENPCALELVIRVLLPFALTLADVHASGVVHRDIKEANILMRQADGQPVLVDFGAAGIKEGAQRLTLRLPPGTAEYRSPEALRFAREWEGEPYPFTPGDDLWALGVVLYGLLTRGLPFGDRNEPGLNQAILERTPPAPHELNPRVPLALSELCMGMLEKEPEARYPDAKALAEDLVDLCTQADGTWRSPMFPEARRDKSPAAPGLRLPRRWWITGLVAATVLVVTGVFSLSTAWRPSAESPLGQRTESSAPSPSRQAISRQEIAPDGLAGEVVHGAAPETSSTHAPAAPMANHEEPSMLKSKKTRALIAATCVAGSACASGPQQRQPPEPAECPPGSDATVRRFNILPYELYRIIIHPFDHKYPLVPVSEGDVTGEILPPFGDLPGHIHIHGKLFFGKGHLYGRFTQARLPDGELVPVCLELLTTRGLGIAMKPGSTSEKARVPNIMSVRPVTRFN